MKSKHEYHIIIERDENGMYVAEVVGLRGCHTQAKSMDVLLERVKEAIQLCLEAQEPVEKAEFVGVQRIAV